MEIVEIPGPCCASTSDVLFQSAAAPREWGDDIVLRQVHIQARGDVIELAGEHGIDLLTFRYLRLADV